MQRVYRISRLILLMAVSLRAPYAMGADGSPTKSDDITIPKPSGNLNLKIGHPSAIGVYDVPTELTHERLNKQGWKVESVTFSQTALNIQALSQGTVNLSIALSIDPLRAIEKGGKIKWMMENTPGEFVMIAKKEIAKCENLTGSRFAIHGETSGTSVAGKRWVLDVCKASPNIMVLPGGENRIIALRNGQIDATLVQLSDWLNLDAQAPGKFHVIVSGGPFNISGSGLWTGNDWLEKNREVAVAYVAEAGGLARHGENLSSNRRLAPERRRCFNARGRYSILHGTGGAEARTRLETDREHRNSSKRVENDWQSSRLALNLFLIVEERY